MHLQNKMFHIWDESHRFKASYNTREMKLGGIEYLISPTSIILDGRKKNHFVITSLCNDINM